MIRMAKSKSSSHAFDDKTTLNNNNKKKQKKNSPLSELEMEAARQLVQLSNGDSCSDHHRSLTGDVVEDNNSSNSNSFSVQGRPRREEQHDKLDAADASSGVAIMEEGESSGKIRRTRRRKNKRYRFILDLYSVTEPVISCY